jgi:hypothetical protein
VLPGKNHQNLGNAAQCKLAHSRHVIRRMLRHETRKKNSAGLGAASEMGKENTQNSEDSAD